MRIGYRATAVLAAAGLLLGMTAAAAGAAGNTTAPGQNKLQCFDGTTDGFGFGGTCTRDNNGAKGSATLALTSSNPNGDYAGVFTNDSNLYGQALSAVRQAGYSYTASAPPTPTDLSYNIPIDTDGNGSFDAYAFVDAFYCPGTNGNVDIVNDPNCGIYLGGTVFYPNWAALVAALPGAKIANDGSFVFVIAERVGGAPAATYTVNHVVFGKPGK